MLLGVDKRAAAEFSFFLAIPIMVGAFSLDIWESRNLIDADQLGVVAVGFVVSFLSGLVVIRTMLGFIQKRGFAPFGWWRIVVGLACLAMLHLSA
jgi:undecaprenyl-diphosphatase